MRVLLGAGLGIAGAVVLWLLFLRPRARAPLATPTASADPVVNVGAARTAATVITEAGAAGVDKTDQCVDSGRNGPFDAARISVLKMLGGCQGGTGGSAAPAYDYGDLGPIASGY